MTQSKQSNQTQQTQSFPVAPLSKFSLLWLTLIVAIAPAILLALLMIQEFRAEWMISIPMGIFLIVILTVLWFFSSRRRIELHGHELTIAATFYTQKYSVDQLDLEQARILRLDEHVALKPTLKTNGYAVPGFNAGHFRSRQWKKMFCLVTNPKVLILPVKNSEAVIMLSPIRPQALLDALQEIKTH